MANLPSNIITIPTKKIDITGITNILEKYLEYKNITEQSKIERERIQAQRDIIVTELKTKRELILDYFEKRFDERKNSLNKLYDMLDKGFDSRDEKLIYYAISGILGIIKENPLGDLETLKKNMLNHDYVIDL